MIDASITPKKRLPLATVPMFTLDLPISKKKVQYRAFTVREEQHLAQAVETGDDTTILNALNEIVQACVKGIDVENMPFPEFELLMVMIRAKSVGERITLQGKCQRDANHKPTPIDVDLEKTTIVDRGAQNTILLYDDVGVKLKIPSFKQIVEGNYYEDLRGIEFLIDCIESVFDSNTVYNSNNYTREEIRDFVLSLNNQQIGKIMTEFVDKMPHLSLTIQYVCQDCQHVNEIELRGSTGFFG